MRRVLAFLGSAVVASMTAFLGAAATAGPITVETVATADTFVRQNAPDVNYGTNGGLSVAGAAAVNGNGDRVGLADTFLRFDLSALVASLDSQFGSHDWTITDATLRLVEYTTPANSSFGRGQGTFEVRWIAADGWLETVPTWNNTSGYLDGGTDQAVGEFTNLYVGDQYTPVQRFALTLDDALVADIRAGGTVSFYLTAASETVGATFNSQNITGTRPKPFLEITAVPEPATIALLGLGGLPALAGRVRRLAGRRGRSP